MQATVTGGVPHLHLLGYAGWGRGLCPLLKNALEEIGWRGVANNVVDVPTAEPKRANWSRWGEVG